MLQSNKTALFNNKTYITHFCLKIKQKNYVKEPPNHNTFNYLFHTNAKQNE